MAAVVLAIVAMVRRSTLAIALAMIVMPAEVPANDDGQNGRRCRPPGPDVAVMPATPSDRVCQQCKDRYVGGEELHTETQSPLGSYSSCQNGLLQRQ